MKTTKTKKVTRAKKQPVGELSNASDQAKTKLSAVANDFKSFRDKLHAGGLSDEDKALLDKAIAELDALYAPAQQVENTGTQKV